MLDDRLARLRELAVAAGLAGHVDDDRAGLHPLDRRGGDERRRLAARDVRGRELYARNVLDFVKLDFDAEGRFRIDLEDDIVKACLVCRDGQVLRA